MPDFKNLDKEERNFDKLTWDCLHPYRTFRDDSHTKIKYPMILTTETKNGIPHGLCFINYIFQDDPNNGKSFNGFGLRCEGELHGGPLLFLRGDGKV
jgi:hypothetical protein